MGFRGVGCRDLVLVCFGFGGVGSLEVLPSYSGVEVTDLFEMLKRSGVLVCPWDLVSTFDWAYSPTHN